jgi:8-oxo-dGTP diphosphatase
MEPLPYKISALVYLRNEAGELLLMKRNKSPNFGLWSPVGGKLEMGTGESPHCAAVREVEEETGLSLSVHDLHLFGIIAENHYEDTCHWLMFLFDCGVPVKELPPPIEEGTFGFIPEEQIPELVIPDTDRMTLWPTYFKARQDFTVLRADCAKGQPPVVHVDEKMRLSRP